MKEQKAFRKILSVLTVLLIFNMTAIPAYSKTGKEVDNYINAAYTTPIDVENASIGQVVKFVSVKNYKDNNGLSVPKGTSFSGKVISLKKGRMGYRRAKVQIAIDKMTFPTGESYKVNASTKKYSLKGSAIRNTAKGIITAPAAVCAGAFGTVVIVIESVSIIGIPMVSSTGSAIGDTVNKLTRGVNYKKQEGDFVKLRLTHVKGASLNVDDRE